MSSRALLLLGTVLLAPACTVHTGTYPEPVAPVVYGNAPVYSYAPVYAQPGVGTPASCTPVYAGAPIYNAPVHASAPTAPAQAPTTVIPVQAARRVVLSSPQVVAPHAREPRVIRASAPRVVHAAEPAAVRPAAPRVVGGPRVVAGPSATPSGVERPATTGVAVVAPHAPGPRVDPSRVRAPLGDLTLRPLAVHPVVYQPVPRALRTTTLAR